MSKVRPVWSENEVVDPQTRSAYVNDPTNVLACTSQYLCERHGNSQVFPGEESAKSDRTDVGRTRYTGVRRSFIRNDESTRTRLRAKEKNLGKLTEHVQSGQFWTARDNLSVLRSTDDEYSLGRL